MTTTTPQCKNKYLNITYGALLLLTIIFACINCNHIAIWYDEAFSIFLIKKSYLEIWNFTAIDVHPPLYYWMLKLYSSILGDNILVYRSMSAIPIIIAAILGCTSIRKTWGDKTALFFMLFILLHFSTQKPIEDIRMYSWSMLFVLTTYISAFKLYSTPNLKYTILLVASAMAAGYTHYYSLLAAAFIFLFFIILAVCQRKSLKYWIIASITCVAIYAPWLKNMIDQISVVSEGYWITEIHAYEFIEFFNPYSRLLVVGIGFMIAVSLRNIISDWKNTKTQLFYSIALLTLACLPIVFGIAYSFVVRPVILPRYFYCTLLLVFLSLAQLFSISDLRNKLNIGIYILFFALLGYAGYERMLEKLRKNKFDDLGITEVQNYLNQNIDNNTAFVYNQLYRMDLPEWIDRYPNNTHIAKARPIDIRWQMLELISIDSVYSYDKIDLKYDKICTVGLSKDGLLDNKVDSTEIVEYYDIVDRQQFANRIVHILERKKENTITQ